MTEERMALIELVEKQADGDLVREMLAFAAERIMEAEIEARTGAATEAWVPYKMAEKMARLYRVEGDLTEEQAERYDELAELAHPRHTRVSRHA